MNFELWLFTIKRLGTTMDVAMTIYESMSPDRQKMLRDEYEKEYNPDKKEETKESGGKSKVKVTVLRKQCFDWLQSDYLKSGDKGPCRFFDEGQEFIIDEESYYSCANGKFCHEAWNAISKHVYAALYGGNMGGKNITADNVFIACCNSGTRPVIFKIEKM